MAFPVRSKTPVIDHLGRQTLFARDDQSTGAGSVRQHQRDLERSVGAPRGVGQRGHVGSGPRDQDPDPGASRHCAGRGAGSPTDTNDPGGPGKTTGLS